MLRKLSSPSKAKLDKKANTVTKGYKSEKRKPIFPAELVHRTQFEIVGFINLQNDGGEPST